MDNFFPQNNWEPFVYQRLNEIISHHQHDEDAYVIFDFDNTSAIMDIEDNLMMYFVDNLLYRLTPEEFHQILTPDFFKAELDQPINKQRPNLTLRNLANDIIKQYRFLYEKYCSLSEKDLKTLDAVRQTEQFQDFRAKLRAYYQYANGNLVRENGEPWLTYWFSGYQPSEFRLIIREMLDAMSQKDYQYHEFTSSDEFLGEAGIVTSYFYSGLSFPVELTDLFKAFQTNGITTYIVSASPVDLVEVAAEEYGYHVPNSQVVAMEYQLDSDGRIQAKMAEDGFVTKEAGKTAAIRELIMPKHNQREPIALFGDSIGDYHMMVTFKEADLCVLFNRYMDDEFRELVEESKKTYQQPNARYVLQGRDENKGELHPQRETIPHGTDQAIIHPEELF